MTEKQRVSQLIKSRAAELGFSACGIVKAEAVSDAARKAYEEWIAQGAHGEMGYMARNIEKRMDPTQLVEGCRSIIVVAQNYYPATASPNLSRYAQGKDYHRVVKDKLFLLLEYINTIMPTKGRPFCDSAPVLERYWAVQAGIGTYGRNRQLILPACGTYFFLGELFIDAEAEYDTPLHESLCNNCNACIKNCPTGALSENGLDARRCLSYLTIEYRGELPPATSGKMGECIYGCDRCQRACPHNRMAQPHNEPQFTPSDELLAMKNDDWKSLTKEKFDSLFKDSAVQRCGYEQLMRNIKASKL
jgi:epoxyqueuosine reductase